MMVSLDGYFEDTDHSIAWVNLSDDFEWYSITQLDEVGGVVFGRRTYDGMVPYWTSVETFAESPSVAARMNAIEKTVISSSPNAAEWTNTTIADGSAVDVVASLKQAPGKDLVIFGSSTLTSNLLAAGLIDELRVMVSPVLLGGGTSVFAGLADAVDLELLRVTSFRSGNVLLCYRPRSKSAETGA
jgi:dihydrofolate reductase